MTAADGCRNTLHQHWPTINASQKQLVDFPRFRLGLRCAHGDHEAHSRQEDLEYWIAQAKREATQRKRIEQMLDELDRGDVCMNMAWRLR